MPVEPRLVGGKVRQVEVASGAIAINSRTQKPIDGGGWAKDKTVWATAGRQATHANDALRERDGESGVPTRPRLPAPRRSASPVQGPSRQHPM